MNLTSVFDKYRQVDQHIINRMMAEKNRERQFCRNAEDRQKRAEHIEDNNDAVTAYSDIVATQLADPERLTAFEADLDIYDTAVVEALMENTEALETVQAQIDIMLHQAHVIDDGRRVFKTEDGTQVYDEHGASIIDPMAISANKPTWEEFSSQINEMKHLEQERTAILDYQEKLDTAREQLANGDITNGELDRLETSLTEAMPDAVRDKLPADHAQAKLEQVADVKSTVPATTSPTLDGLQGFSMPTMG